MMSMEMLALLNRSEHEIQTQGKIRASVTEEKLEGIKADKCSSPTDQK